MRELTHPVELRDQELDLIAGGGGRPSHGGGDKCCGGDNDTALINIEDNNVNVLNNISVLSAGVAQGVFN
jgi:hypothetical protein